MPAEITHDRPVIRFKIVIGRRASEYGKSRNYVANATRFRVTKVDILLIV